MGSDEKINICINTNLGLGLNLDLGVSVYNLGDDKKMMKKHDILFPCLTSALSQDKDHTITSDDCEESCQDRPQKQKKEACCEEQEEVEMGAHVNEHEEDDGPRKKLRLTKQQSRTLEDSFNQHTTLNPKQKQVLAARLNLRPRQVEVWFQNRRARTKLKQTEEECEVMKKYCETLKEENKKLRKEVQELKLTTSFYMHLQPPTLSTVCPSCERLITSSATTASAANSASDDVVRPNSNR